MSRHRSGQAGNTGERSGRRGWMGLALFAALTLGACDDGGGTAPSNDAEIDSTVDATPTDAEVDAEVDAGPVTLRFIAPEDGATLTGANDLTGDLADGLQIEARLAVQGAAEVNLSVDGAPAQRLPVVDGVARAVVALPVAEEATHRLEATAAAARAAVDVQVAVARCALVVEPLPGGGCDLGADDDADPIAPGLQTDLRIETYCPEVDVRVEGIAAAATVDNGRAVARITLRDGENEIRVQAKSPTALPAEIGPYRLVARVEAPLVALDLRAGAENVRGLDAARREGQSLYWQFTGQAVGLEAGDEVQVEFAPPLDAAATARVDPDGGFAVEAGLPADTLYIGAVTVRATDACGAESADMTYALRLDGVVPTLRLVAPADGTRLFRLDDIDGERSDVQVPITV
ncbi:MAG: hypothetical protein KC620_06440, partial [Myxococcales bacterium]|nr:hypothetical protein [Myxococcales bacterium]